MADRQPQDRREIEDCLLRYVRGVDRKNWDMVRSSCHVDAHDGWPASAGGGLLPHLLPHWALSCRDGDDPLELARRELGLR